MSDEIWKDIPGYEGIYQVSSAGRVRSLDRVVIDKSGSRIGRKRLFKSRIMKLTPNRKGYLCVDLYSGEKYRWHVEVHVLVSRIFLGPLPDGHHAHHENEDKTDNSVDNLEYVSISKHSSIHHRGEKARFAILKEEQITEIRDLLEQGVTLKNIGDMYGVHLATVSDIKCGKTWTHV